MVPWQESYRWATNSRLSRGGLNYFYDIFVSLKYFHSVPSILENTVVLLGVYLKVRRYGKMAILYLLLYLIDTKMLEVDLHMHVQCPCVKCMAEIFF